MKGQSGSRVRLVDARMLSPSVRSLVFEPLVAGFAYRAGQSVQLTVPTATGIAMRRPYSIASAPGLLPGGRFELAVTRVEGGPTSEALHALSIGAEIIADDPHGGGLSLRPDERAKRMLLVATGTGLAPCRAHVQERLRDASPRPLLGVLFGCRTTADILWRDELDGWAREPSRIRVEVTQSRPGADWTGRTGHVQRHLAELVRELEPELLMICGLSPMVDDVVHLARELGVPDDAIRTEAYDQ